MAKILIIATIYRCGEKMYPVIKPLLREHDVDVLLFSQMSPQTPWYGSQDLRQRFYANCKKWGANLLVGPTASVVARDHKTRKLAKGIDFSRYKLVILDDNLIKPAWGTKVLCDMAHAAGVTVVGCPHGNTEFESYRVTDHVGKALDYSFVFGEKERKALSKRTSKSRLLVGGIPANDVLKKYKRTNKYILIIPSYVEKHNARKVNPRGYLPFNEKSFLKSGVLDLQQKLGCRIVVKEKSRFKKGLTFSLKGLEKYDGVKVIMDCDDDNRLVTDASALVSAPSTLCFKAIQVGIPTALLRGYGMTGNFNDFQGLVECEKKDVIRTITQQQSAGRDSEFIKNTLGGGLTFSATQLYLDQIERLLQ